MNWLILLTLLLVGCDHGYHFPKHIVEEYDFYTTELEGYTLKDGKSSPVRVIVLVKKVEKA